MMTNVLLQTSKWLPLLTALRDPQRYRHQVDNQRAPQAEGNRYRQAVFNQLQHRSAAKQAIAKIKTQMVAEHLKVAFVNGFIEAVAVG